MACYLVTGGCGFIGRHLVKALLAGGHRVRILDNLSSSVRDGVTPAAELRVGDVADPTEARRALRGVDGCYHLAAVASVQRCNEDLLAAHQTNIGGFLTLLAAARDVAPGLPFVYASSAAVYGERDRPAVEAEAAAPISHYGCDKLACELHGRAAAISCGSPSIGLRFFNVFGPGQNPGSPYSGVISIFMDQARRGRPVTLYGDGQQVRDFVFVGDVVDALQRAMAQLHDAGGERMVGDVLNVCTGRPTTIAELAASVGRVIGRPLDQRPAPARPADIRFSLGCPKAAEARLGFRAETGLEAGLRRLLADTPLADAGA